jgi:hypothetical protein
VEDVLEENAATFLIVFTFQKEEKTRTGATKQTEDNFYVEKTHFEAKVV